MKLDAVISVKEEFAEETFLRQVLIHLGTLKDAPMDLVDAEFKEVRKSVKEVLCCTAYVKGTCTASVGYDRKEPYTDYETYTEKVGDRFVKKQRPVTKYRTVTDWRPFNTQYAGQMICTVYNSGGDCSDDGRIATALRTIQESSYEAGGEATVNKKAFDSAIAFCERKIEKKNVSFPGDHVRDKNYQSQSTVEKLVCFKLPYYEVTYTYKGEEYTAGAFACGAITVASEHPSSDVDVTAIVKEKTKELEKKQKISWYLFFGSAIVGFILIFAVKFAWMWPISAALLLLSMKSSKEYKKAYTECSDSLSNDLMKTKVETLAVALRKHGFTPMGEKLVETLGNYSVTGAAALKDLSNRIKGSWVLVVFLALASLMDGF